MFGFSWSEIGLIIVVALLFIGPKDLPVAIRTVTGLMRKARGMASEFQGHLDELVREADLQDVRTEMRKLRSFDFRGAVERQIDPDGSLKSSLKSASLDGNWVEPQPAHQFDAPGAVSGPWPEPEPQSLLDIAADHPAFIPPEYAHKKPMPAFIPPGTRHW